MQLDLLRSWLETEMENARPSGDGAWLRVQCPWCGHQDLSIHVDSDDGSPLRYKCFSASCDKHGVLTTDVLREWGCVDPNTLSELAAYNATINPHIEKSFQVRESRNYALVNLARGNNEQKLRYIQDRLGVPELTIDHLKDFKIQLSILDMLRINDIRQIAASKSHIRAIDVNCIGFVSIYDDYLICRNIAAKKGEMRYYNYRLSGKPDKNDLKIYCLPTDIDIMDPKSANINVAEGVFSLLGAYFHTDIGKDRRNNLFLANCGTMAGSTVMRVCKQYGLTKVRLNFFSDSEIPVDAYQSIIRNLKNRLDIRAASVYYCQADDFGHNAKDIGRIERTTLV